MKISSLHLENFKRFSDLEIGPIPNDTKLVLLIGSNGSGKSSVFDAFGFAEAFVKGDIGRNEAFLKYYQKQPTFPVAVKIEFEEQNSVVFSNDDMITRYEGLGPFTFYGRTSFRKIPRLERTALGQGYAFDIEKDSDRPKFFIERDARFENDIEKITETILKDLFRSRHSSEEIRKRYIDPINEALANIFGANDGTYLKLIEIIPPLEGRVAQITFQKGVSEIHYNYLSAGEKEIFNLLVNLLSRKHLYQDSIYFLDEIDLHLNTQLQFKLIKEIVENWIPHSCQMWTASHSLGFIEYARQSENATIIDLDNYNFDLPRILIPEPKENHDVYEIAVSKEFLPSLFKNQDIFFVENKDKEYYASASISNTIFVSENNRNNVFHKVRSSGFKGIVDRDFLSDDDISIIIKHYPRLHILPYYSIESFLYHPDNLEEYYMQNGKSFDKSDYIDEIRREKNKVRAFIIPSLALKRTEYPYFCEPQYNGSPLQNRFKNKGENMEESGQIASYYESDEFEIFYKCFPMKSYCTQLSYRSSVPKSSLSKTAWFRKEVEILVGRKD